MTSHTPPTDQQLDEIEARLAAEHLTLGPWMTTTDATDESATVVYVNRTSPKGVAYSSVLWNADWATEADAEFTAHATEDVRVLLAEVRRLRAANEQLDRALGETIDDRDQAHEILDKLAYAVAPVEVIGEHSSMNCPWTNALGLITPAAEVDKLRADRAAAWRDLADRADPAKPEISWFGEWGHQVGEWIRQQAEHEDRSAAVAAVAETGQ